MRPIKLLLIFLFLFNQQADSQSGFFFIKKRFKKVLSLTVGDQLHVKIRSGKYIQGAITGFRSDTVYIEGQPVKASEIHQVIFKVIPKKKFPDTKTLSLIGAGSALTTAGLTLSKQQERGPAICTGMVIGFGPLLLKHFGGRMIRAIGRKKYVIGKRFRVQIIDLPIQGIRAY